MGKVRKDSPTPSDGVSLSKVKKKREFSIKCPFILEPREGRKDPVRCLAGFHQRVPLRYHLKSVHCCNMTFERKVKPFKTEKGKYPNAIK